MISLPQDISRIIIPSDWKTAFKDKKGDLFCMYKSPNKKTINGKILFKAGSHDNIKFKADLDGITNVAINYKKNYLKISLEHEKIALYTSFHAPVNIFQQKKSIYCIDVTEGGLGITSDSDSNVFIWTTENGEIRRELRGHFGDVYACRFFPSGVVALTGGADTQLKIWAVDSGECAATLVGHQRAITGLGIVEKGRNVVSSSKDGSARLWDVGQQKCLRIFGDCDHVINSIHVMSTPFARNEKAIENDREVGTSDKILLVGRETCAFGALALSSNTNIFSINTTEAVNCCTSLSEYIVAFGCQDSTVSLIDIRNAGHLLDATRHSRSAITSLRPRGSNALYVTTADGSCFLLDAGNLNYCVEFTGSDCEPIYGSAADDKYLYTCCRDGNVRKYKV